jgi:hypothetical protein
MVGMGEPLLEPGWDPAPIVIVALDRGAKHPIGIMGIIGTGAGEELLEPGWDPLPIDIIVGIGEELRMSTGSCMKAGEGLLEPG